MTSSRPSSLRTRAHRSVRIVALVTASLGSFAAVSAVDAGSVAAEPIELPVNQLAPEIIESATAALAALDMYNLTGSPEAERIFEWNRAAAAGSAARQLGYDGFSMLDAWSNATIDHQRAVLGALTQIGVPYRYGTMSAGQSFDCSGLTTFAWQHGGIGLVRQSGSQIAASETVSRDDAQAGDLVHYPGHIMIYLGVGDAIIHAPSTGRTVELDTLSRSSVTFGDPTHSA